MIRYGKRWKFLVMRDEIRLVRNILARPDWTPEWLTHDWGRLQSDLRKMGIRTPPLWPPDDFDEKLFEEWRKYLAEVHTYSFAGELKTAR